MPDPKACEYVVAETVARFGKLDVLVNNAGRGMKYINPHFFTEPGHFWEADPEVWRMVIDTNVNGPFFMARAAVPYMLLRRSGAIINLTKIGSLTQSIPQTAMLWEVSSI